MYKVLQGYFSKHFCCITHHKYDYTKSFNKLKNPISFPCSHKEQVLGTWQLIPFKNISIVRGPDLGSFPCWNLMGPVGPSEILSSPPIRLTFLTCYWSRIVRSLNDLLISTSWTGRNFISFDVQEIVRFQP